jgi:phosphoribosylamine--glycine ligase/phosphoribosylformylglycinamidine cyclo-ligase
MTAETLRILLIGNGGREHSLAWKLDQPPRVEAIYVVQGNSGIGCIPKVRNIGNIKDDYSALLSFSLTQGITLVVPSTEKPLVDGIKGIFGACEEIVKPTIECREGRRIN